jgi:hypothetical protein
MKLGNRGLMPKINQFSSLMLLVWLILVGACVSHGPQQIVGQVTRGGVPSGGVSVRFVGGEAANSCEGDEVVEVRTDERGEFQLERVVPTSRVSVVVDHVSICVRTVDGWRMVWKKTYGPAARRILLNCDLARPGDQYCSEELKL